MAKGKFFNGKVKKSRSPWIFYGLISVGIILIIILLALISASKKNKNVVLELKNTLEVEVNSKVPETKEFFTRFENYSEKKIKIGNFDITKVGEYDVEVQAGDSEPKTIKVKVIDTTAPKLKVKDVKIKPNEKYKVEDFIESCKDNSKTECIVQYYQDSIDENEQKIDYSSFRKEGKYVIKIVATDSSGNSTVPTDVNLIIQKVQAQKPEEEPITPEPEQEPVECKYGNLTIDQTIYNFPVAIIVGDQNNNCAINRDLWDSEAIENNINNFYNSDYQRLKKQLEPILKSNYPYGAKIVAYPQYTTVLNETRQGLVGYGIYVTVYIADAKTNEAVDQQKNLKLAYYIKSDTTREYKTNEFNLDK